MTGPERVQQLVLVSLISAERLWGGGVYVVSCGTGDCEASGNVLVYMISIGVLETMCGRVSR